MVDLFKNEPDTVPTPIVVPPVVAIPDPVITPVQPPIAVPDPMPPNVPGRQLNPTELLFSSNDPSKYVPQAPVVSDFDPYRTNLVYGDDNGKVFKAHPGKTVYSTTIPPANEHILVFMMTRDGQDFVDQHATLSVDDGPVQDMTGAMGPVAVVADPGFHTFTVECNYEWSIEIQFRPK